MSYQRFYPQQSGAGSFLTGFVAGALVGMAVGVLLAPHKGDVTRRKIVRQAGETRDEVIEAVEDLIERRETPNGDGGEGEA
ncbi:MAG: YtxH domain-containing protein [Candidatus Latescibacterota bacterium]|nr:YtxH domain-containing protein [Candidatus Latescibacterota bacterium]